jgi:hypothetical protein
LGPYGADMASVTITLVSGDTIDIVIAGDVDATAKQFELHLVGARGKPEMTAVAITDTEAAMEPRKQRLVLLRSIAAVSVFEVAAFADDPVRQTVRFC